MGHHYVAVGPSAVKVSYNGSDKKSHASMHQQLSCNRRLSSSKVFLGRRSDLMARRWNLESEEGGTRLPSSALSSKGSKDKELLVRVW